MRSPDTKTRFAAAVVTALLAASAFAADMLLVDDGTGRAPIVVTDGAPAATLEAATELAAYLEKISGARPTILVGDPDPLPAHAIWVGPHPRLPEVFPEAALAFEHPEEILHLCNGDHLLITGRDRTVGETQTEFGTANAVYTFLEKSLGVRWLWPGELGEDIPRQATLAIAPFEYRFHPLFRQRWLWPRRDAHWHRVQRMYYASYRLGGGHAYTTWWDQYHETHPEYFALQPDGSRTPPRPHDAKLCVSNPDVARQWLANAEQAFRDDPAAIMYSATPNDGPWFCVCENCRAWDPPDGPPTMGHVSLTDRYVRYWNHLARGLRERFPDREAWVGAYAYSAYKHPPVKQVLEKNIAIGYVGHFPLAGDALTHSEKEGWRAWADKASNLVFRPNLFHYSGGWLGLPTLALRRTIEDFRFLAEHKCIGIEVDTLPLMWATQGVQYYLMAQLAYDPLQDGEAVLRDYCRRGFGPAAEAIAAYFDQMEEAHEASLERIRHSGAAAREAIAIFEEVYTDPVLDRTEALMRAAEAATADGPEIYRRRVAFLRLGHDFVSTQVHIIRAMTRVRESRGQDGDAVRTATELCAKRAALLDEHAGLAFRRTEWYHDSRKLDDYMGPPSAAFLAEEEAHSTKDADFEGRD